MQLQQSTEKNTIQPPMDVWNSWEILYIHWEIELWLEIQKDTSSVFSQLDTSRERQPQDDGIFYKKNTHFLCEKHLQDAIRLQGQQLFR